MTSLKVETDPRQAGFDPERLARIDAHFAGYAEDGRLPGWLLTVSRHGRLAHVATCGSRDLEAGLPVTDDTPVVTLLEGGTPLLEAPRRRLRGFPLTADTFSVDLKPDAGRSRAGHTNLAEVSRR